MQITGPDFVFSDCANGWIKKKEKCKQKVLSVSAFIVHWPVCAFHVRFSCPLLSNAAVKWMTAYCVQGTQIVTQAYCVSHRWSRHVTSCIWDTSHTSTPVHSVGWVIRGLQWVSNIVNTSSTHTSVLSIQHDGPHWWSLWPGLCWLLNVWVQWLTALYNSDLCSL